VDSNNKAWLSTEYHPNGYVVIGNKLGLEELKNTLNEVLIDTEIEKTILITDLEVAAVTLQSDENHFAEIDVDKKTWADKVLTFLLSVFAFIWFVVLPIVAVNFLVSSVINNSTENSPVKIEQFKRL